MTFSLRIIDIKDSGLGHWYAIKPLKSISIKTNTKQVHGTSSNLRCLVAFIEAIAYRVLHHREDLQGEIYVGLVLGPNQIGLLHRSSQYRLCKIPRNLCSWWPAILQLWKPMLLITLQHQDQSSCP